MLLREEPDGGVLAITQPEHAALSGRLAEAWDDELPDGLLVAAAHHDDVWTDWDATPRLNAATGRPLTFPELVAPDRVEVWSQASARAAPLGLAAELWVLRHAERLHRDAPDPALQAMTATFTARLVVLVDALRAAGAGRPDDAELARGTSLLTLLDALSLALCSGVATPRDAGVLRLAPAAGDAVAVAPWPFRDARVETVVEARALPPRSDGQAELDAAWTAAPPLELPVVLVPA